MRQAQPGHHFPHHWMTDAHTMRAFKPRPQFAQFRAGPRFDLLAHGAHQRLKPKRHVVVLRPGRGVAMPPDRAPKPWVAKRPRRPPTQRELRAAQVVWKLP